MGPADFLDMLDGYNWRAEREDADRDAQLYLLRLIATVTINANTKKHKQKDPEEVFYIPSIDDPDPTSDSPSEKEATKQKLRTALDNAP